MEEGKKNIKRESNAAKKKVNTAESEVEAVEAEEKKKKKKQEVKE